LLLALLWPPILAGPIEEARTLMEQGRYEQAVAVLEEALRDEALKPAALVEITRLYNETEDYEKSVDYGKQAIEALPESSAAHLEYARALKIKMNKVSRIKSTFLIGTYKTELRKALELDPENVRARVEEIGFFIYAPGVIGGSETKAQERIDSLKKTAWRDAMLMQANLRREQKDPEGAIRTYEEMIGRDPEDAFAYWRLGLAYEQLGRVDEAREALEKAVALDGDNEQARTSLEKLERG
jgi:tetratricopeptide (TPR) repeat protein